MDIKLTVKVDDNFIEDVLKAFLETAGTEKDFEDCILESLEVEGNVNNIRDTANECTKFICHKLLFKND